MRNWVIILLLVGLAGPVFAELGEGPEYINFSSTWGAVSFQHHAHQTRAFDCMECHHEGVEMGSCRTCHGAIAGIPLSKDVLHKKCKDCHRQQRGPTECQGCHDPELLDESVYEKN